MDSPLLPVSASVRRARWGTLLLLGLTLSVVLGLDPIPQDPAYHQFSDRRAVWGIPNFWNVISNLPFLAVGGYGLWICGKSGLPKHTIPWTVCFLGIALVAAGSGYYHWHPDNRTLVWDRLPMSLAFMGLFAALVNDYCRLDSETPLLVGALAAGLASVWYWSLADDLRFYGAVQFAPLLILPVLYWIAGRESGGGRYLLGALLFYLLAKIGELNDGLIYDLTGHWLGGHALKHLLAALAAGCLLSLARQHDRSESGFRH